VGILGIVVLPVAAYLLGSVPWGLIIARVFGKTDIRRQGSGNIGATNVRRLAGNRLGALTLVLDAAKGAVPVVLAAKLVPPQTPAGQVFGGLVALCAIAGHMAPVYLKFRGGGKGVATAAGGFAVAAPAALVVSLLVFVLLVCLTSRASAGSLGAAVSLPLWVAKLSGAAPLTVCAAIAAALIIYGHRDNIVRLATGREPRI